MRKAVTESEVIQANRKAIELLAKKYGKGLEKDDRISIASIGCLLAMRTYDYRLNNFQNYMELIIKTYLRKECKQNNRIRRTEADFSLDRPVSVENQSGTLGETFFSKKETFQDRLEIKDFLEHMEDITVRSAAKMLLHQLDDETIRRRLHLTKEGLLQVKAVIWRSWQEYTQTDT